MILQELSHSNVGAAFRVHTSLGSGLLERTYQVCLAHELRRRGIAVESEVSIPVFYEDLRVELGYRIDLVVENAVAVEVKAVTQLLPVHRSQVLTQLKFSRLPLGLLFNFHEHHLKDGLIRVVNTNR